MNTNTAVQEKNLWPKLNQTLTLNIVSQRFDIILTKLWAVFSHLFSYPRIICEGIHYEEANFDSFSTQKNLWGILEKKEKRFVHTACGLDEKGKGCSIPLFGPHSAHDIPYYLEWARTVGSEHKSSPKRSSHVKYLQLEASRACWLFDIQNARIMVYGDVIKAYGKRILEAMKNQLPDKKRIRLKFSDCLLSLFQKRWDVCSINWHRKSGYYFHTEL